MEANQMRKNLNELIQLAEKHDLDRLTIDEISEEVTSHRKSNAKRLESEDSIDSAIYEERKNGEYLSQDEVEELLRKMGKLE